MSKIQDNLLTMTSYYKNGQQCAPLIQWFRLNISIPTGRNADIEREGPTKSDQNPGGKTPNPAAYCSAPRTFDQITWAPQGLISPVSPALPPTADTVFLMLSLFSALFSFSWWHLPHPVVSTAMLTLPFQLRATVFQSLLTGTPTPPPLGWLDPRLRILLQAYTTPSLLHFTVQMLLPSSAASSRCSLAPFNYSCSHGCVLLTLR